MTTSELLSDAKLAGCHYLDGFHNEHDKTPRESIGREAEAWEDSAKRLWRAELCDKHGRGTVDANSHALNDIWQKVFWS